MYKLMLTLLMFVFLTGTLYGEDKSQDGVTRLYVATFNRAPDSDGIKYWLGSASSSSSLEDICKSFFNQQETSELYPEDYSNIDFIVAVYANLFNREPDDDGLTFWANSLSTSVTRDAKDDLEAGIITRDNFILAVINGAQGKDATILANKTEVGLAFSNSGSNDVASAKDIMSGITEDRATVEAALDTLSEDEEKVPPEYEEKVPEELTTDAGVNEVRPRSSITSQKVDIKYLTKDNLLRVTEYLDNAGYKGFKTKTIDRVESDFDATDKEYYIVTFKEGGYIVFDTNINANAIYSFDENAKYSIVADENLKTVSLDWMSIIAKEVQVYRRSTRSSSRTLITKIVWESGSSRTDFDLFVKNPQGDICNWSRRDKSQWGAEHLRDDQGAAYKISYEAFSVDLNKMDEYASDINNFNRYKFYIARYTGPNISYNFSFGNGGECSAYNGTNCPNGNWKRNVSNTGLNNALSAVYYQPKKVDENTCDAPSYRHFKISNPTCQNRRDMYKFLTVGGVNISNNAEIIKDKMNNVNDAHTQKENLLKIAKTIMKMKNIKNASSYKLKTIIAKSMLLDGKSDVEKEIINTLETIIKTAIRGGSTPTLAYSQGLKVLGMINDLYYGFSLDSLTEDINNLNISKKYLELYYEYGSNQSRVALYSGIPMNSSLINIINKLANNNNYYNNWYGTTYHVDKIEEHISDIQYIINYE